MTDTPIGDAIKNIPKNQLNVEVSDTQKDGVGGRVTLERENAKGTVSGGVFAETSKNSGWGTGAFFKWMFGGK